jgi:hypothetical protein
VSGSAGRERLRDAITPHENRVAWSLAVRILISSLAFACSLSGYCLDPVGCLDPRHQNQIVRTIGLEN